MSATWRILEGDCVEVMAGMAEASVDAVVCDPPYGLEFMGKEWDRLDTYAGGNPAMKQHRGMKHGDPEQGNPWASERTSYGAPKKNPRCRKCGKLQRGNGACKCPVPEWDTRTAEGGYQMQAWHEAWATEALRVLKPGGHLLAFGGTRTSHRLACAIEDAGFEIRDTICWLYGSGFPKSLDVSKAIDKRPGVARHAEFAAHLRDRIAAKGYTNTFDVAEAVIGRRTGAVANWQKYQWPEAKWWPALRDLLDLDEMWGPIIAEAEREKIGNGRSGAATVAFARDTAGDYDVTSPTTPEAERWNGWGTALKPAHEPIVVARKPLAGTVAGNVLAYGTGALNVDGCRVGAWSDADRRNMAVSSRGNCVGEGHVGDFGFTGSKDALRPTEAGRWPSNVVLDEQAAGMLDEQTGELPSQKTRTPGSRGDNGWHGQAFGCADTDYGDSGGASRFYYVAKSSSAERNAGLDGFEAVIEPTGGQGTVRANPSRKDGGPNEQRPRQNLHPTVKPIALMRWLVRLATPPAGIVLDPFAGSGTTGCAAVLEGFRFVGVEREAEYAEIARARVAWWAEHPEGVELVRRLEMEASRKMTADSGQMDLFG